MKKILFGVLLVLFALGLVGCDQTKKYTLTVIKDTDFVTSCPNSGKYKPGKKWEIKTAVIIDAGIYVYANNERVPKSHYDSDYWGFEFTMPEEDVVLVITMDQFYGKTEYTFEKLFYQTKSLNMENVEAILESSYNSKSKMSTVLKSTDIEDFKNILSILNEPLLIVRDETIDFKNSETIQFTFINDNNYLFELTFVNGYVLWNDFSSSEIFRFDRSGWTLPRVENESEVYYHFANYNGLIPKYYLSDEENKELGRFDLLFSIDFKVSKSQLNEEIAKIYIDSQFGNIYCFDARTFLLEGVVYEVISEYDFSVLF